MTVDEILAGHEYRDRRGRKWQKLIEPIGWVNMGEHRLLTRTQMRLLIERDQHRDECRGLAVCEDHPVPSVNCYSGVFEMWPSGRLWSSTQGRDYGTLYAAMTAARALAVGE